MKKREGKTIKSQHYLYPGRPDPCWLSFCLELSRSSPAEGSGGGMERDVRQDELTGAQPLRWLRLWSTPPSRSPAIFFGPSHIISWRLY
jgi:hypothetical protein